jgi:hypothetical protein
MGPGYPRSLSRVQDRVSGEGGPRVSTPYVFEDVRRESRWRTGFEQFSIEVGHEP